MYILKKETYLVFCVLGVFLIISFSMIFIFDLIVFEYLIIVFTIILVFFIMLKLQQKVNRLFHEMFGLGILHNYHPSNMINKYKNASLGYYLVNMKACYQMNNGEQDGAVMTLKEYLSSVTPSKVNYQFFLFSLVHLIVIKLILDKEADISREFKQLKSYQKIKCPQIDIQQIINFIEKYLQHDANNIEDCLESKMPYYIRLQLMYLIASLKSNEEKNKIYQDICSVENEYYLKDLIQGELKYD